MVILRMNSDTSTSAVNQTVAFDRLPVIDDCRKIGDFSSSSRISPSQRSQRIVRSSSSSNNIEEKSIKHPLEEKIANLQRKSFKRKFCSTVKDYDFHNFLDHGYEFRVKNEEDFCDKAKTIAINRDIFYSVRDDASKNENKRTDEIHKNPNNLDVENSPETQISITTEDDFSKFCRICDDFAQKICQLRETTKIDEEENVEDLFLTNLNKLFIDNGKSIDFIAQFMKILRNEKLNNLATEGTGQVNSRLNRSIYHSQNLKSFFLRLIALCNNGSRADFTLRFNWFLILNLPDHYFSDYLKLIRIVDFENPNFLWKNFLEFSQLLNENQSFDPDQLNILKILAQFFEESEEMLQNLYENDDHAGEILENTTFLLIEPKFFGQDDNDDRENRRFLRLFCKFRSFFKRQKMSILSIPKFSSDSNVKDYVDGVEKFLIEKIGEIASKVRICALVCFCCPMSSPELQEQVIQHSKTNIPTMFISGQKAVSDVDFSSLKDKSENFAFINVQNANFDLKIDVGKLCAENLTQNLVDEQLMVYIQRFLAKMLPIPAKGI